MKLFYLQKLQKKNRKFKKKINKFNSLNFFRTNIFINEEKNFIDINYLKEENNLLRDIIDQAARSIADVIQVLYTKKFKVLPAQS